MNQNSVALFLLAQLTCSCGIINSTATPAQVSSVPLVVQVPEISESAIGLEETFKPENGANSEEQEAPYRASLLFWPPNVTGKTVAFVSTQADVVDGIYAEQARSAAKLTQILFSWLDLSHEEIAARRDQLIQSAGALGSALLKLSEQIRSVPEEVLGLQRRLDHYRSSRNTRLSADDAERIRLSVNRGRSFECKDKKPGTFTESYCRAPTRYNKPGQDPISIDACLEVLSACTEINQLERSYGIVASNRSSLPFRNNIPSSDTTELMKWTSELSDESQLLNRLSARVGEEGQKISNALCMRSLVEQEQPPEQGSTTNAPVMIKVCPFSGYSDKTSSVRFRLKKRAGLLSLRISNWNWLDTVQEKRPDQPDFALENFSSSTACSFADAAQPTGCIENLKYTSRGGRLEFLVRVRENQEFSFRVDRCCSRETSSSSILKGEMIYRRRAADGVILEERRGVAKLSLETT